MNAHAQAALPITVIILTKNEAAGIVDSVKSVVDFDEVIVVDSDSTDDTKRLARLAGAQIANFTWSGGYPKKKQWCLESVQTKYDWIFLLDADERVSPALVQELLGIKPHLEQVVHAAYEIELDYVFLGRVLRHGHRVVKTSLVNRRYARYEPIDDLGCSSSGEVEGHYQPAISGSVGRLHARILHNDPDPVSTWVSRHNRYSDWEAYLRTHPNVGLSVNRMRSRKGQIFAKAPAKPLAFFIYDFVAKRGFMDGRAGFNYAFANMWYYWLTEVKVRESRRYQA